MAVTRREAGGLTWSRRPHRRSREEAAQLWPSDGQQRVCQRCKHSTERRRSSRSRRAHSEEVAAPGRQRGQVRRQRLRAHQQGRRAHWVEGQRCCGGRAEAEAVVEDLVTGAHARLRGWTRAKVQEQGLHFQEYMERKATVKYVYAIVSIPMGIRRLFFPRRHAVCKKFKRRPNA